MDVFEEDMMNEEGGEDQVQNNHNNGNSGNHDQENSDM